MHWLVVLAIALLVFGPRRLPEVGKGLGSAIRGFRDALNGKETPGNREDPPPKP